MLDPINSSSAPNYITTGNDRFIVFPGVTGKRETLEGILTASSLGPDLYAFQTNNGPLFLISISGVDLQSILGQQVSIQVAKTVDQGLEVASIRLI